MCDRAINVDAGPVQYNTVKLINIATAGFFSLDMLLRCIADGLLLTPEAYLTVNHHPPTAGSPAGERIPSCPAWHHSIWPGETLWACLQLDSSAQEWLPRAWKELRLLRSI